jgi:hypothetical protein
LGNLRAGPSPDRRRINLGAKERVNLKTGTAAGALVALALLTATGCGVGQPGGTASRTPTPVAATPTATPTEVPTPTPVPTPPPVSVPDFQVVAYQGDATFGGHSGRFSAVFAAGRPVVLLYFAGL